MADRPAIPVPAPYRPVRPLRVARRLKGVWRAGATLLAALAAVLLWPASAEARRVALVIGNAAYADMPLRNPVNDATDLAARLRQLGFEVTMLTDRNRSQMTQAIVQFGQAAQGAEAALFYFAGHGVQVRGRNFLMPVGQKLQTEAEVEADAVEVGIVLARLEEAGARVSLLVLDACRTNPLVRSGRSAARGLARMDAPSGALVAFAAQPGAEAQDGDGRNGTYTKHLLEHIASPGLKVEDVFKRVRADVERETGRRQSPREESSLTSDFYFANPFAPVTPQDERRIEDEAWALCRQAANRVPCDEYLSGWPRGRYLELARTRVRELEMPAPAAAEAPGHGTQAVVKDCDECPEMIRVSPGRFMMGSPASEPFRDPGELQRSVRISRPYLLGRYEVTQDQWRAVMGDIPAPLNACGRCPVEGVSWNDVQDFIRRLNQKTGKRFRLPTEAEWEYAARAGTTTPFSTGDSITHDQAHFGKEWSVEQQTLARVGVLKLDAPKALPVGSFEPNAWGFFDMHGNAAELVQDCFGKYTEAPTDGSAKEVMLCGFRVVRGGHYGSRPPGLRSAHRWFYQPFMRDAGVGFRLARSAR